MAAITDTSGPMGTLTSWHTTYLAGRIARGEIGKRTAKGMRYSLRSFDRSFGNRPLDQLKRRAVLRWLEQVGHLSPATRRNHLSAVRGFCRWLVSEGVISEDPTAGIDRVRQPRSVPRAMRRDDIARLFAALPDLRARLIVTLMVEAGLRCVEVSRLDWEDWDPTAETLTVKGKGGHERVLPDTFLLDSLRRMCFTVGMMSTKEISPMTTTETMHLVVDMRQDLIDGSDDTYRLLEAIADGDEPAQIIDGIHVTEDNAGLLLQDYVAAWERAWIATAEAMGHDAIAAGGGSPQAHDHIRSNSAEALDRSDTGVSAVEEAWQAVWDRCPTVTLAEAVQ